MFCAQASFSLNGAIVKGVRAGVDKGARVTGQLLRGGMAELDFLKSLKVHFVSSLLKLFPPCRSNRG